MSDSSLPIPATIQALQAANQNSISDKRFLEQLEEVKNLKHPVRAEDKIRNRPARIDRPWCPKQPSF
jgi:hypothetical protein